MSFLLHWLAVVLGATIPSLGDLAPARVALDRQHRQFVIESPPADLPAAAAGQPAMVDVPPCLAIIPADMALYSVRVDVIDSAGRPLPKPFLHHFNLTVPTRRDLFLPIAQRFLAASKETPAIEVPRLLVGMPLERDARLLATAMLSNPTPTPYHGVRVRVTYGSAPASESSFFPIFRVYPWTMDAQFPDDRHPTGTPAYDLPPGRSTISWESQPAIPGYIIGIGGHVHDYGVGLELADVTTGAVLWRATVVRDEAGHVLSLPVTRFYNWHSLGLHIDPTHRYRVTATYDNPTGHMLPRAGMGSVAGLFIPDRAARWPGVDTSNAIYQHDLAGTVQPDDMGQMEMGGGH